MIIAPLSDPQLLSSVRRAARPDEDVITGVRAAGAFRHGFPRAAVWSGAGPNGHHLVPSSSRLPVLALDPGLLKSWEEDRRWGGADVPPERTEYVAFRIRGWLRTQGAGPTWVDLCLRDLTRAVGRTLPLPFRGMARRVLEFPARYPDLGPVASAVGLSTGALKARFRRRGLSSPHVYLRWLRSLAVAEVLSDPNVTTIGAAHRLGMSSGGNLCRAVLDTTGVRPTDLRNPGAHVGLLLSMVEHLLGREALAAWDDLDRLFYEVA